MADPSHDARARADAKAGKKLSAEREGAKARAAYDAEAEALRAKTARLRALRLAKEEADRKGGATVAAPNKTAKPKSGTKSASNRAAPGKLADWLDDQKKDGRSA